MVAKQPFRLVAIYGPSARSFFFTGKAVKWLNQVDEMVAGFVAGQTKFYRQVTHTYRSFRLSG